ncbi:helix-turn-helix domain-containing protein [Lacticaseibacillus absianus]|uniref:helix-turn-helix domain-containing protein n=1 Tax=Lacticaseibacillus absianus TaxID=2729623 RepID=UPI0015CB020A|nr:helix-turn-helix transcriptional regulator [Lacticaseibacillus absianus]
MADESGPTMRRLRQMKGITQADFYADVLSPRQAIRFENGENAPRLDALFPLIARLGLTLSEFDAQRAHQTVAPPVKPALEASAQAVIAKLAQWPDWQLTATEHDTLRQYALTASVLSLRDIVQLMTASWLFDPSVGESIRDRLWRDLQVYRAVPGYQRVATGMWTTRGFDYAVRGQLARSRQAFEQALSLPADDRFSRLNSRFYLALLHPERGAAALYQQTQPLILGVWQLGDRVLADGLVDNRRHILTAMGVHAHWRREELGAMARMQRRQPAAALSDAADYYTDAVFPGLTAALAEFGGPLRVHEHSGHEP